MAKSLKDILNGTKKSKVVDGNLGGYEPKAGDEKKFVRKHKVEKHDDRVGNGDDIYQASNVTHKPNNETNKGHNKGEDEKVYEEEETPEPVLTEGIGEARQMGIIDGGAPEEHSEEHLSHIHELYHKIRQVHGEESAKAYWHSLPHKTRMEYNYTKWNYTPTGKIHEEADLIVDLIDEEGNLIETPRGVLHRVHVSYDADGDGDTKSRYTANVRVHAPTAGRAKVLAHEAMKNRGKMNVVAHSATPLREVTEQQLDELNKKTLGSYINKAHIDATKKENAIGYRIGKDSVDHWPDHMKKKERDTVNRMKGIQRATARLTKEEEELEQIDEISKKVLGSYVKKASGAEKHLRSVATVAQDIGFDKAPHTGKPWPEDVRNLKNRKKGIERAVDRLTKEEEELDEVSKKTLTSYVGKAAKQVKNTSANAGYYLRGDKHEREAGKDALKRVNKRVEGIATAAKKLAKEEAIETEDGFLIPIDESSLRLVGRHTSKDGKKIAKVYKDNDWDEFRVKHYTDGKHHEDADYHTDDKDDAHGTAKKFVESYDEGDGTDFLDEKLSSGDPLDKWVKDFVNSSHPKFRNKSVEERKKMALGAYYGAQNKTQRRSISGSNNVYAKKKES